MVEQKKRKKIEIGTNKIATTGGLKKWIFCNNREQIVARTDYIETVNHAESIFLTYSMLKNPTTETTKFKKKWYRLDND